MFNITQNKLKIDFRKAQEKISDEAAELLDHIPLVHKRKRRRRAIAIIKIVCWSILVLFVLVIVMVGVHFTAIKRIAANAWQGKIDIDRAVYMMRRQDFKQAIYYARASEQELSAAVKDLAVIQDNFFIGNMPLLNTQFNDAGYLLRSAVLISRAMAQAASLGQEFKDLLDNKREMSYAKFSGAEKNRILGHLYYSAPQLADLKSSLDLAFLNLTKVHNWGIFWTLGGKMKELKDQLRFASTVLEKAIPASKLIPVLAGYPGPADYLVLLQNSDELRPTGGFIGTFGLLRTENGDIASFETHDSYHLDMPVKDAVNIMPPWPLQQYLGVDKWYLRDANWSPDWEIASRQIEWMYQQENSKLPKPFSPKERNFSGVIGITPEFITSLLALTGPVKIENVEYNADNFTDLLQYRVEKGYVEYGETSWQRKEVIGQIAQQIKIALLDLPADKWRIALETITSNMERKNLMIYMYDRQAQDIIKELGIGGELKSGERDYLMIVDANMAAYKTDGVVDRNFEYKVEKTAQGLIAKLTINYAHTGRGFDWKTTRYRTYTRVFVPAGSELLRTEGITEGTAYTGQELNKTFFGAFKSIEPGQKGSLYFEYKLPESVIKDNSYSLLVQKQPGNYYHNCAIDLSLGFPVISYNPNSSSFRKTETGIVWKTDLDLDRSFEINY